MLRQVAMLEAPAVKHRVIHGCAMIRGLSARLAQPKWEDLVTKEPVPLSTNMTST